MTTLPSPVAAAGSRSHPPPRPRSGPLAVHWPEALMEALGLGLFMVSAGLFGAELVAAFLGSSFLAPPVTGVATLPGPAGLAVAFSSELAISFALVLIVLTLGSSRRWGGRTGLFVGAVLFVYITFEAPLSGMSMNPARTVASAIAARAWTGVWVYFLAPLAGMLLASEVHLRLARGPSRGCAKLAHGLPCIFCGDGSRRA